VSNKVKFEVETEMVMELMSILGRALRPDPKHEPHLITIFCAKCNRLDEAQGAPTTADAILCAAHDAGWTVIGNKCYCPSCKPETPK
jgi:hypothetical protein